MKKGLLVALLVLVLSNLSVAGKKGIEKDRNVADTYYALSEYALALSYYTRVYNKTKSHDVIELIADCYEEQRLFDQAYIWRKKAYMVSRKAETFESYLLAMINKGIYMKAASHVEKGIEKYGERPKLVRVKTICDSIKVWKNTTSSIQVANSRRLNTEFSEMSPVCYNNKLVFCSSREDIIIRPKYGRTNEPFYDLYQIPHLDGQLSGRPKSFSPIINSKDHEGACSFSDSGNTITFTRIDHSKTNNDVGTSTNTLKMYQSSKTLLGWTEPLVFRMDDTISSFGHPSISEDGSMFFFVSDMPGGYGGKDIYVCIKLDTLWSDPINLGNEINTAGDELYPFLKGNDTFYFSSDTHIGYGGFDLFVSSIENGVFRKPQNLKAPINSSYDDFSIYATEKCGWFASNRPGGMGREDIYQFIQD